MGDLIQIEITELLARVYYTSLADAAGRRETARALGRARPFLRREIGRRLRLKRVPDLEFVFDESIEQQDRIERLLRDLHTPAQAPGEPHDDNDTGSGS